MAAHGLCGRAGPERCSFYDHDESRRLSIIRVHALVFGSEAGAVAQVAAPWIIPAALVTLVIGALGVLATRRLADLVCFAVIWSMGSLLVAIGLFDGPGLTAALYYTVHSTLAGASLFLLVDLIAERRGRWLDQLSEAPQIVQSSLIAGLFFLAAIAMTGLPPLSGFIGKLLILDAARQAAGGRMDMVADSGDQPHGYSGLQPGGQPAVLEERGRWRTGRGIRAAALDFGRHGRVGADRRNRALHCVRGSRHPQLRDRRRANSRSARLCWSGTRGYAAAGLGER